MEFDVNLTVKDIHQYLLTKTYRGPHGIFSIVAGVVMIILGAKMLAENEFASSALFCLALGVLLPCSVPLRLWLNAKKVVHSMSNHPVDNYVITEDYLIMTHNDITSQLAWDSMCVAEEMKFGIVIYPTRTNQILIPKRCVGDLYQAIVNKVAMHMPIRHSVKRSSNDEISVSR